MAAPAPDGFDQWKRHILHELEEHGGKLDGISEAVTELKVSIATVRVKASLLGLIAGALGGLVAALLAVAQLLIK